MKQRFMAHRLRVSGVTQSPRSGRRKERTTGGLAAGQLIGKGRSRSPHACASLLLAQAPELKVIQEILGRSTLTITAGLDAHVMMGAKRQAGARAYGRDAWNRPRARRRQ